MYERWCDTCEKPMKCHKSGVTLYCIGCKSVVDELPTA